MSRPTTLLQPALVWTPQALDSRWPETDCTRCLSNGHANPRYCDLVVFELWAAVPWLPKCVLLDWDLVNKLFRYSVAFIVCSTTTMVAQDASPGSRHSQENVLQSIMLPPLPWVWLVVHCGSNLSPGKQHILTRPSAWWMTNFDSSGQATLFYWSMVSKSLGSV